MSVSAIAVVAMVVLVFVSSTAVVRDKSSCVECGHVVEVPTAVAMGLQQWCCVRLDSVWL